MLRAVRADPEAGVVNTAPMSAVIPNREGCELLGLTLPPLLRELPPGRHEILVIDDASQDGSLALLAREFPSVRVVALRQTVGFGAACNRGFHEARHDLVLLLNSDMQVTPGSVARLVEHFAEPEVFAAGPRYIDVGTTEVAAETAGRVEPQLGSPAGGGVFRRRMFLELGGFDSLYDPFYWEDLDLGWNAWLRGWRILHDTRTDFLHLGSVTIRKLYSAAYVRRVRARNRMLFGWKNLRSPRCRARFHARSLARAARALLRADAAPLLGVIDSFWRLPRAVRSRNSAPPTDDEVFTASASSFAALDGV